jgi:hypothetical protein
LSSYRDNLPRTRDVARETGRGFSWTLIVGLAVIVLIAIFSVLIFGFGVFTSDARGRGDAVKQKNSGTNRINAQERFEDLYADVTAADQKLDPLAAAAKANPDSQIAATNYTGATTYCIDARAAYDAEARKYTAREFRAADLPPQIDQQDPATDCKPTKENDQ